MNVRQALRKAKECYLEVPIQYYKSETALTFKVSKKQMTDVLRKESLDEWSYEERYRYGNSLLLGILDTKLEEKPYTEPTLLRTNTQHVTVKYEPEIKVFTLKTLEER